MAKDYMYVKETPWGKLGTDYSDDAPNTSEEIIKKADLDWNVAADKMYTEHHREVYGYHTIYREDDSHSIIGVVNKANPVLIQNRDSFNMFESIIGNSMKVETSGHFSGLRNVFGCFRLQEDYKIFDDEVDPFIVIMNDHLDVSGMLTVLCTPIRVVCQNTLSAALSNNWYKTKVHVPSDKQIAHNLSQNLLSQIRNSLDVLRIKSERYEKFKYNSDHLDKIMDEMFPIIESADDTSHDRQNEQMEIARWTFQQECIERDDLQNYDGSGYQIMNAILDFSQHYFKNVDKAYDLTFRMGLLPGLGVDSQSTIQRKAINLLDKMMKSAA